MNKKFYRDVGFVLLSVLFCLTTSFAGSPSTTHALQDRIISGKVTSPDGESLPGVSVLIKGSNTGTVTDTEGSYKLTVPSGDAVVVFSFIGFSQEEITVGNQTVIDIILTPSLESLSEVVVIGYGTVKKSDLTGSVSSIKADELKAVPVTSFDQALDRKSVV